MAILQLRGFVRSVLITDTKLKLTFPDHYDGRWEEGGTDGLILPFGPASLVTCYVIGEVTGWSVRF